MGITIRRHLRSDAVNTLHTTVDPFAFSIGTRVRDDIFLRMLQPQPGDRIIDVGCGLGHFTHLLAQTASCTGVDVDTKCLAYCRKHLDGNYMETDIRSLPFPPQSFNKALCSEVLEHIEDNGAVLDEIGRVLITGGMLVASVPCSGGMFGGWMKNIGHSHVDGNSLEYHHHKGFTLQQLTRLLEKHGYTVIQHDYTMVMLVEIIMMATKLVVHGLTRKRISSQSDALQFTSKGYWKLYRLLFPLLVLIGSVEQPLSRFLKGHMVIVKAVKE